MRDRIRFKSPLERALFLKGLPGLEDLSPVELGTLAGTVSENAFRRGQILIPGDSPVTGIHLITEGRVEVSGGEYDETTLGPGEGVGMLSLLARGHTGLTARALTDVSTLDLHAEDLYDIYEDHFSLLFGQIRDLARRVLKERKRARRTAYLALREAPVRCSGDVDLIERLLFLLGSTVFKRSNMDAVVEIARQAAEVRFGKGEKLWSKGDPSGYIYVTMAGSVRCEVEGDRFVFRTGPGYPLGNVESMAGEPRWYDAVAEEDLILLRSEADFFIDILEDHFEMALDFLAAQATNLIRVLRERREAGTASVEAVFAVR